MTPKDIAMASAVNTVPSAVGVLSAEMSDHLYLLRYGFIFTSPWVVTGPTLRHPATVLLTAAGAPFELSVAGRTESYLAVASRPLVKRGLRAENVRFISIHINPDHPRFRAFSAIPMATGMVRLDRGAFTELNPALERLYCGQCTASEASILWDTVVATAASHLPPVKPIDVRVERVMELLERNAACPLAELAAATGLSYDRMSHLFSETIGLPLRSYQLWRKAYNAALLYNSGRTLTEIAHLTGFTDSAHLSRTIQQSYGIPPSYFLDSSHVKLFV